IEDAEQVFEKLVLEFRIVLGKLSLERLEVTLNRIHGIHERCPEVLPFWKCEQSVVTGFPWEHERTPFLEISEGERALGHLSGGLISLDVAQGFAVTVGGVAQKDHAEHRHAVFTGRELRVSAEIVCGVPEVGFEFFDILESVLGHSEWEST